jgi:uncharacterized protein (DUF1697 family)
LFRCFYIDAGNKENLYIKTSITFDILYSMKYVALLRGINVGGNMIIKMSDLKKVTEECGFTDVRTYIQSGNIIFRSEEKNIGKISVRLEDCFLKNLKIESKIIIRNSVQFKAVVSGAPPEWENSNDLRCYIAFIKEPVTARDVMDRIKLKEGVDFMQAGQGAVYMSTLLSGLTKSGFTKMVGTDIYKEITIRNYNTVKKLVDLLEAPS